MHLSKSGYKDHGNHEVPLPDPRQTANTKPTAWTSEDEVKFYNETSQLMRCFLGDFAGIVQPRLNEIKVLPTMKSVVGDLLEKHKFAYNSMIDKLSLDNKGDDVSFVTAVASNVFSDGKTNWGRIVSLVAFGAVVCRHLSQNGKGNLVELVADDISNYLLTRHKEWIVKNKSWDGFWMFFAVPSPDHSLRDTLATFAGCTILFLSLLSLW